MQIFTVKKDSNVAALLAGTSKARLQTLQRLNPQLDFKRIGPGDMIIVPDETDKAGDTGDTGFPKGSLKTIGADAMDSFSSFASQALADASRRLKTTADRAKAEEGELAAALRNKTVSAALSQDPQLKAQAEEALALAKGASKDAAASIKTFDRTRKAALAELALLEKRLR